MEQMLNYNDPDTKAVQECGSQYVPIDLKTRLKQQKADAEKSVARLDELIRLLEANPETERILELLGGNKY